jgi:hypothetical protein
VTPYLAPIEKVTVANESAMSLKLYTLYAPPNHPDCSRPLQLAW